MTDPYALSRFLQAQAEIYDTALAELRAGQKRSHFIWFIFPQLKGLGRSETALYYGIASRAEASAYVRQPVLGARLKQCTEAVLAVPNKTAHDIFGTPDDLKFRSSITLFAKVAPEEPLFQRALAQFFGGAPDAKTLELLARV
jgi:uncharacterized protein (DUF1810 family)